MSPRASRRRSAGRYLLHIARVYSLDQVAQAHDVQDSGETVGKILIAP